MTSIGDGAFSGCISLTGLIIPDSVTSIGESAFTGCAGLTSLDIPSSVKSVGDSAFEGCAGLTSVNIPNSMTSISWGVFEGCVSLASVSIPNSVEIINNRAFYDCGALTEVKIPSSVTSIGWNSFYGCSALSDIYYSGTESQWDKITIDYGNEDLLDANIHFLGSQSDVAISNISADEARRKISADFKNLSGESLTFSAICAVYDANGALIACEDTEATVASGDTKNVEFDLSVDNWASYKLFAWDDFSSLTPLGIAEN